MERIVPDSYRPRAFKVVTGDTAQSWVDLDDPTRIDFEYVQRIVDVLNLSLLLRPSQQRLRFIHIGGGGLSLPRYLATVRPHSAQIVLEPDTDLLAEVRRVLPLRRNSGIKVREVAGREGVAALPDDYADGVILDAFDGHHVPGSLASAEFFADLDRTLRPGAVLLCNVTDQGPFTWTKQFVAGVRGVFGQVLVSAEPAVLRGRRFGNLVVVAGHDRLPIEGLTRAGAGSSFPYRLTHGRALDRWLGGARAFSDATVVDSPGPPSGRTWFS